MIEGIRAFIWRIVKKVFFRFDAEGVHLFTIRLIKFGIHFRGIPLRIASGSNLNSKCHDKDGLKGKFKVLDLDFRSPIGLAAGFDKNAEILEGLPSLGFGFAEIGTVTPRPQHGNLPPRLFRDPNQLALFNRMGFNNLGASIVANRVARAREHLPDWFRVGINIGKNKDTLLESSQEDYVLAAKSFEGLADYLVINVSSPNTEGLRSLQTKAGLTPIVSEVLNLISGWRKKPPLFLKIAPELDGNELYELIPGMEGLGIDGWVLTNTLAGTLRLDESKAPLSGGWSGQPLTYLSREKLISVRKISQKVIISVGGVLSAQEAIDRIHAGANLIQVYTGWIYQGPTFPMSLYRDIRCHFDPV